MEKPEMRKDALHMGIRSLRKYPFLIVYAFLLSAAIVLGKHLHVSSPYEGLLTENFILPYHMTDLGWFLVGGCILSAILVPLFVLLVFSAEKSSSGRTAVNTQISVIGAGKCAFLLTFLCIFLGWLPYLFRYAPGFISGDAIGSLREALGLAPLSNRNPVLYTLFSRFCLLLGGAFSSGNLTAGCLIYSVLQMLFFSFSEAYLIRWLSARFSLHRILSLILTLVTALCPYLAQDSIAMWKDPVFSGAVVLWTLTIADFCLDSELIRKRAWRLKFLVSGELLLFWRHNGITAVIMLLLFLLPFLRRRADRPSLPGRKLLLLTVTLAVLWAVVTGPISRICRIGGTPREESVGLMLNQMARVAALDGDMGEEDRVYLDSILPLELYASAYHPCTVDLLKWDSNLNAEPLYSLQFYKTWGSLLLKNPLVFFEAWELESYGFWTVNRSDINLQTDNISYGAARNSDTSDTLTIADGFDIHFGSAVSDNSFLKILPKDSWSVPLGILNWFLFFAFLVLYYRGDRIILLALAPSVGIAIGMLAGTPIWYLPRYELPVQMLFPFYLALLFFMGKNSQKRT